MKKEKLHLNIIVDGLGYEIAKKCRTFSFLSAPQALDTVLGFSSSAIPTILTGKRPEEHGRWNLFYYNKKSDFPLFNWFSFLPASLLSNRYIRKALLIVNKGITNFPGYYQAYDFPSTELGKIGICESTNIYDYDGVPGSETIIDFYKRKEVSHRVYSYKSGLSDDEILEKIHSDALVDPRDYIFAYLCEYDAFGHHNATNEAKMITEAERYGERIGRLVSQLEELYEDVSVTLCSDHGMVPLKEEYNLQNILDQSDIDSGSYKVILDSTMARFYVSDAITEDKLRMALKDAPGHFLTDDEIQQEAVQFHGVYGNLLFIVEEGVQISPSHMGRTSCQGMHGYMPDCDDMKAVFMSNYECAHTPQAIWEIHKEWTTQVDNSLVCDRV